MTTRYWPAWARRTLLILLVACTPILVCQGATFAEWEGSEETTRQLKQDAEQYASVAEVEGLDVAFGNLRMEILALSPINEQEREKKLQFIALITEVTIGVNSIKADISPIVTNSLNQGINADTVTISNDILAKTAQIETNKFPARKSGEFSGYVIAEFDQNEIRISKSSESTLDREIWRGALIMNRLVIDTRLPILDQTKANVADARESWALFMTNVVHDQYFWETLVNGALARWCSKFEGTLTHPPTTQLRLLHPSPVFAYSEKGSSQFNPRIAVEVLGYRKLSDKTGNFQPRYGWSIVSLLPGSQDEEFGWGVSWGRKNFSIGLITRDVGANEDVLTLTFGLKTSGFVENGREGIKKLVNGKLDDVVKNVRPMGSGAN